MNRYYEYELPVIFLDIRSRREYCHAHLPKAILIQTNAVPQTEPEFAMMKHRLLHVVKHLPKQSKIIVYCKSGLRANESKRILNDMGFVNVTNLGGVETEPIKSYMLVKGMVSRC